MTEAKGTEMNTCLGYTESQRNQAGTHTGLWYDDMAQCCVHTVDRTGCSGDRRTPENRLQCGQRGEESGWQGEIELYRMRVIKEFWTTRDQTNRSQKYRGEGRRRSRRVRLYCNPPINIIWKLYCCKIGNYIREVCFLACGIWRGQ